MLAIVVLFYAWFGVVLFYGTEQGVETFPNLIEGIWTLWICELKDRVCCVGFVSETESTHANFLLLHHRHNNCELSGRDDALLQRQSIDSTLFCIFHGYFLLLLDESYSRRCGQYVSCDVTDDFSIYDALHFSTILCFSHLQL